MTDPAPSPYTIDMLDVSRYQDARGPIDWAAVAASGVAAVYVKATEGTGYVNPGLVADVTGAVAAGLAVGAYLFLRGGDGAAQANAFLRATSSLPITLPAAVDVEVGHSEMGAVAESACAQLEAAGLRVVVYTYEIFQSALAGAAGLGRRLLWLASYHPRGPVPAGPWAGGEVAIWQYSGKGQCPASWETWTDRGRARRSWAVRLTKGARRLADRRPTTACPLIAHRLARGRGWTGRGGAK